MSDVIKVKPWSEDQGEYVLINAADFDPSRHEKFDEAAPARRGSKKKDAAE